MHPWTQVYHSRKKRTPWVYHIQLTWRHRVPLICFLFLSTWAEVSTSCNTTRSQMRLQLKNPAECQTKRDAEHPRGQLTCRAVLGAQCFSRTRIFFCRTFEYHFSGLCRLPTAMLFSVYKLAIGQWMQYFFFNILNMEIYSFTEKEKKKNQRKKLSFSFYSSHLTTSFLTAYFRQQHYRTLLHMCRNKKKAQNELKIKMT